MTSPTLSDEVYTALKRQIITLQRSPGTFFTESEVAGELETSNTPVREAIMRLRHDGLVDVRARSKYRVTPVTLKDARDLCELRTLLDGEAARLAAIRVRAGALLTELEELDDLAQTRYDPSDVSSIGAFMRANIDLHTAVASLGGNAELTSVFRRTLERLERLHHVALRYVGDRIEDMVHEHTELLGAIRSGDPDAAFEVATAQSRASQDMVLTALMRSQSILTANL